MKVTPEQMSNVIDMDTELKEKWVNALRSGNYKQGQGVLRSTDGQAYCCLGVLCDIMDEGSWSKGDDGTYMYYHDSGEVSYTGLGRDVRERTGVSVLPMNVLISLNDSGASFEEIASYIEREL